MEVDDPLAILFEGQPAESDKTGAFSWRRIQVGYVYCNSQTRIAAMRLCQNPFLVSIFSKATFYHSKETRREVRLWCQQCWSFLKVFTLLTYRFIPPGGENVPKLNGTFSCQWMKTV